ncbi:PepSY domain-containing protein [Rhodobacterales bacterium HKCCE3408]|nr:PepSY domain-containing protein [Rhodobacterales bacterium HKCCE3408]
MTKTVTILGFLSLFPAGVAFADDDCFVPMADWQPRDAVARLAEENGWTVRRIKIDDGCYEIAGQDADGRQIEVTVHPETLQVIDFEYEFEADDDRNDRDHEGGDDD